MKLAGRRSVPGSNFHMLLSCYHTQVGPFVIKINKISPLHRVEQRFCQLSTQPSGFPFRPQAPGDVPLPGSCGTTLLCKEPRCSLPPGG